MIVITDKDYDGMGISEVWTHWFICPSCSGTMIMIGATHCQDCGVKLDWQHEKDYK